MCNSKLLKLYNFLIFFLYFHKLNWVVQLKKTVTKRIMDKFIIVPVDDIFVYSNNDEGHVKHIYCSLSSEGELTLY